MEVNRTGKSITRYSTTNEKLKVGHKAYGWTLKEEYERFNLWQRASSIRECFYKDQIPNFNSRPSLIEGGD